ncbi:MAG: ammonium transporter [Oscillospiraceae bacterium]|jgi:Amt family ammonium transporter|nr:ammonium transporter [Oscillospiraceae bacterium]
MENIANIVTGVNIMWTLVAAALVFFMQAGFALVEGGLTRTKNAGNILMKNLMDFACGVPVFWFIGFGLMWGGSGAVIGVLDLFTGAVDNGYDYTTLIFQSVFCATAATIVSGSMAERTKFKSYIIYSVIISAIIYPISGRWIWNSDGWLNQLGFHDFAGSTAVHMVGGISALLGAIVLGPRIGKYGADGKPKAIPGHNLTLAGLGTFLLWFCWFGFNGGSTTAMLGETNGIVDYAAAMLSSRVFVTTNISACLGAVSTMLFTWFKYKKPDVSMTLNGALAGLVAITAGCDVVNQWAAAVIGLIAGIVVVLSVEFLEKKAKVDDPVGAVSVHGACGALGTILTGVFVSNASLADMGMSRGQFFGIQVLGVVSVAAYVAIAMLIVFKLIKAIFGLRVSAEDEILGLDLTEHGLTSSYAGFLTDPEAIQPSVVVESDDVVPAAKKDSGDIEIVHRPHPMPDTDFKFTKVDIITRPNKLEDLKVAMNAIGITGMTVTNVMGYGMQKGNQAHYRGIEIDVTFLPKVKLEIVVCKVPIEAVIDTAKRVLYTGNIGDGKIFVYDVENIVKVRTGEEGYDALQDVE